MEVIMNKNASFSAVEATNKVMKWCNDNRMTINYICSTDDNTLLLHAITECGTTMKFEIEDADHIGVAQWIHPGDKTFKDITLDTLDSLSPTHTELDVILYLLLGYLNFIVLQWFFGRLTAKFDHTGSIVGWGWIWAFPLTKWKWKW